VFVAVFVLVVAVMMMRMLVIVVVTHGCLLAAVRKAGAAGGRKAGRAASKVSRAEKSPFTGNGLRAGSEPARPATTCGAGRRTSRYFCFALMIASDTLFGVSA
jgi:hypothetical protein